MLLLPKGDYVFRQERLAMDEVLGVNGKIFIINARPARKNGGEGVKLEMLVEKGAVITIKKRGEEQ